MKKILSTLLAIVMIVGVFSGIGMRRYLRRVGEYPDGHNGYTRQYLDGGRLHGTSLFYIIQDRFVIEVDF